MQIKMETDAATVERAQQLAAHVCQLMEHRGATVDEGYNAIGMVLTSLILADEDGKFPSEERVAEVMKTITWSVHECFRRQKAMAGSEGRG